MGGYGSGNFKARQGKRGTTSSYRRIDSFPIGKRLQYLRKHNQKSSTERIYWRDGSDAKTILFKNRLHVSFGDKLMWICRKLSATLYFALIPNNYGGQDRVYYLCPRCGQRVRYLYLIPPGFMCRVCGKLNYESQQRTKSRHIR